MPYFLSHKNLSVGDLVEVGGEEARHILLAHRVKKGEKIKLQGPDRERYLVEIKDVNRNSLKALPLEKLLLPGEPNISMTLFQSMVSEKALDFIFQKGTELGLNKIILFNSANTATKLSAENFKKKQGRWNKILIEAAKQSERAVWPSLGFEKNIDDVLVAIGKIDKIFLADIGGNKISVINPLPPTLGLLVGPEGGFTPEEIKTLQTLKNLETINLGPILLRAETAVLAALATVRSL